MVNGQPVEATLYRGSRTRNGTEVVRVNGNGSQPLPWRLDLWNHSPTGLEWGYGGSGPAQLALAILADATSDDRFAMELHQEFKWEFVSVFQYTCWELPLSEVRDWAAGVTARGAAGDR